MSDKNLIIALDKMNEKIVQEYLELISELVEDVGDEIGIVLKVNDLLADIGMKGLSSMIKDLEEQGCDISNMKFMIDGKWHDIPNTVGNYMAKLGKEKVGEHSEFLTVMASGGYDMMKKAVESRDENGLDTKILAVTVLTSLGDDQSFSIYRKDSKNGVLDLAKQALEAGCDGIVCSPHEAEMLKKVFGDKYPDFEIVTPGIRLPESETDDQKRIMTPEKAISKGADSLVVGRPITQASNIKDAILNVLDRMRDGDVERESENDYTFEKHLYNSEWEELLKYIGGMYTKPEGGKYVRLASGLLSDGYFNLGIVERYPIVLQKIAEEISNKLATKLGKEKLDELKKDDVVVLGAQMGSVRSSNNLGDALSAYLYIKQSIYAEKEGDNMILKRHNIDLDGKKVVICEDVITKGTTTKKLIELVKEKGGEVIGITCAVNRYGEDAFEGIPLISCHTPQPLNLYHDENTDPKKIGNNPKLPEGSDIEESPKNGWNGLIESMKE